MAARKKTTRIGAKAQMRVRKNYVLDDELARQSAACAAWRGIDESALVAEALKRFISSEGFFCVTRQPGRVQGPIEASSCELQAA